MGPTKLFFLSVLSIICLSCIFKVNDKPKYAASPRTDNQDFMLALYKICLLRPVGTMILEKSACRERHLAQCHHIDPGLSKHPSLLSRVSCYLFNLIINTQISNFTSMPFGDMSYIVPVYFFDSVSLVFHDL